MSRWLIVALKWGGLALIVACSVGLLHAALIARDLLAMKLYLTLLAIGFAFGFAGFRWDRKQREADGTA